MSNGARRSVLAVVALVLSILAPVQPARAEIISGVYTVVSESMPPPHYYLVSGVIFQGPDSVRDMPVVDLQVELSFSATFAFLSDPSSAPVLTIFDSLYLPLAQFIMTAQGGAVEFEPTYATITAPVALDTMTMPPPPPDLTGFTLGTLTIYLFGDLDSGSAAPPSPPGGFSHAIFTITPIPEPASLALGLIGAAGIGVWCASRRRRAA